MARSGATVGKAFIYRSEMGPCCFAGYLIRFQFDSAMVEPQLVEAWTQTRHYWSQIREAALQATIENVSAERYKELIFPLPPRADQAHLTREIEQLRLRTDRLRAKLIEQVQLLRERREALITAAITGDIDIPGVAA